MYRDRIPARTPTIIAREPELGRLAAAMERVSVAMICGVVGVGKSTLAYAYAERWPHRCIHSSVKTRGALVDVLDSARRQLGVTEWPVDVDAEERLDGLAAALDMANALWVVDDVHALGEVERTALIERFGGSLAGGRILATSRELLPRRGRAPDRFELRLEGLGEAEARRLWEELDGLYGVTDGFAEAWPRCGGNPLLLRRAHAGGLFDEDPIADDVSRLGAVERRLAEALALSQIPLDHGVLVGLLGEREALPAIRKLLRGLIVDVDGAGRCTVHEVYRDRLRAGMSPANERELRAALVERLLAAELDPVARELEVSRQLRALGRYAEASARLISGAAMLSRQGASDELLRALEAVPPEHRGPAHRVAQAQARCRLLDLSGGFAELEQMVAEGVEPRASIRLTFAKIAMSTGRLALAEASFQQVVMDPDAPPGSRLRARLFHAQCRTYQGFGEDERQRLLGETASGGEGYERGLRSFVIAYTLWLEERDEEAEPPMRAARAMLAEQLTTLHGGATAPAFWAALLARLGRFEEAEEALRAAEEALGGHGDRRMSANLRSSRASLLLERGQRAAALQEFTATLAIYERAGDVLCRLWTQAWIGRVLLLIGRRAEGLRLLDEVERAATEIGAALLVRSARRSLAFDVFAQLESGPDGRWRAADRRGVLVRAQALQAIHDARSQRVVAMRALLAANAALAHGPDYALDRALGAIAEALAHRAARQDAEAEAALEVAREEAARGGVDADIVPSLMQRLGEFHADDGAAAQPTDEACELVLDGRNHELRGAHVRVALTRKTMLRRLLYALAREPGRCFGKRELAAAQWRAAYEPAAHDRPLWVNICRLRSLVQGVGLRVEVQEDGYVLKVPAGFMFVEPPRG